MKIENRPITAKEMEKMHPHEQEVIRAYERITKKSFMRFDVVLLKRLIQSATPAQIIAIIIKMNKTYPDNFQDFSYIVKPVEQMFKNRRGGKRNDK